MGPYMAHGPRGFLFGGIPALLLPCVALSFPRVALALALADVLIPNSGRGTVALDWEQVQVRGRAGWLRSGN